MVDETLNRPRTAGDAANSRRSSGARLLKQVKNKGRFLLWKWKLSLRALSQDSPDSFARDQSLFVAPKKVHYDAQDLRGSEPPSTVRAGDWDRRVEKRRLQDSTLMQSFQQHFLQGAAWDDTDYHRELVRALPAGARPDDCQDREQLDRRFAVWDQLGQQFAALRTSSRLPEIIEKLPKISIAIGRDGALSVMENAPALVLARIFDLPLVPCRVAVRHRKWVRFCREFSCFTKTLPGGQPYQPCTHVDLSHLPSSWSEERFRIIQDCLSDSRGGRLLDIGANLGYFCHRAEDLGFEAFAVESCPRLSYFTRKLKQAEHRRFQVLCGSVLDYAFEEPFDMVLAFNIFHHFIKTADSHQQLVGMLSRMTIREMIFQSHKPGEKQMLGAFRDYSPDEFVRFILDHSCLSHAQLMGADRDRPIYRLRAA